MTRNEAIELLQMYNGFLMEEGYADCDLVCEPPTAMDIFLNTKWAKENIEHVLTERELVVAFFKQLEERGLKIVETR